MKRLVCSLALLMLAATGLVRAETLQIDGSTTVGPIADAFAEYFMRTNPGLEITVKKTGSGDGAAALIDSRCDIATLSRFMKDKEFKSAVDHNVLPVAHAIAMDGVCIIVHPSNTVSALTTAQVRDIYSGKTKNWKEIGGPDAEIVIVSRDTSSGTYETFNEKIMEAGDADLIALARAFLYKPRWGWEAAAALGGTVTGNERYWRCLPREAQTVFGSVKVGQR